MRPDLRLRLRQIAVSLSTSKNGVTGVTGADRAISHTVSHRSVTPRWVEKDKKNQRVTPVTPVTPAKSETEFERHTGEGVSGRVTDGVTDLEDWLAHYDERAGILEFEGGHGRAEAERLALAETVKALGPKPHVH